MVSQLHTRKAKNKDTRGTTGTWSYTNVHIQTWKFTIICVGEGVKKEADLGGGGGGDFPSKKKRCGAEDCLKKKKKA